VPAPTPPILVVDDDEDARSLLEWILRTKGYTTVAVETGRAALEYLRAGQPVALVILDVKLPDMTGTDLNAALKDDPRLAQLPVVLFSGAELDPRPTDVAGYVKKASDPDVLLAVVARCLTGAS